jgi:hypothetical protein
MLEVSLELLEKGINFQEFEEKLCGRNTTTMEEHYGNL